MLVKYTASFSDKITPDLRFSLLLELSSVLWDMTLKLWFNFTGAIAVVGLVIGFAMWFSLTIFILLCMEGLSAFLHALRLHWVEFDGKFYMGDGVKFEPFAFSAVLAE